MQDRVGPGAHDGIAHGLGVLEGESGVREGDDVVTLQDTLEEGSAEPSTRARDGDPHRALGIT